MIGSILNSYFVELDDVDDPGTETRGGARFRPDELGIEFSVLEIESVTRLTLSIMNKSGLKAVSLRWSMLV